MPMQIDQPVFVSMVSLLQESALLEREIKIDLYMPPGDPSSADLLLINDGQDLEKMSFAGILEQLYAKGNIRPVICAGIHAGSDRLNEYGCAGRPDYKGRGIRADVYAAAIQNEILPAIYSCCKNISIQQRGFAGFSLGALSALDMVWNHPAIFSLAGVFSGALWWRSRDQYDREYNEWNDRIMHRQISEQPYKEGLRFFFECGELDEMEDRNRNGVIDSIDDTLDIMRLLYRKGYREGSKMRYLQIPDGRHDIPSWSKALPSFFEWAFPSK